MDKNKIIDIHPQGRLKYTWNDVKNLKNQNLVVYDGNVIDIKLLDMLDKVNIKNYPQEYKILTERGLKEPISRICFQIIKEVKHWVNVLFKLPKLEPLILKLLGV